MSNQHQADSSQHSHGSNNVAPRGDELDIMDIIHQLWKGKKTIIITILVVSILAIIYLVFAKQKWTSETIITQPAAGQIAAYNNALSVLYTQNPEDKIQLPDLQKEIFGRYSASALALSGILKNLDTPQELNFNHVIAGRDDPVSLTFTADTPEEAQKQLLKYINQLNKEVSDDFALDMRNNIFVKKNGLKASIATQENIAQSKKEHRLEVISQAIKVAEAAKLNNTQLSQAEYLSDDTLYLLGTAALKSMITNESSKPLELDNLYYQTQRSLIELDKLRIDFTKLQNFQFIKKPDLPLYRDSPKKGLTLVLAVILGGVLGSCIVIARGMNQNYNRRKLSE